MPYMHEDAHFDVLVDCAAQFTVGRGGYMPPLRWEWRTSVKQYHENGLTLVTPTQIGQMLFAECARALAARGGAAPSASTYVHRPTGRRFTSTEALVAIRGYESQADHSPSWPWTEAAGFCDALRTAVVNQMFDVGHEPFSWTAADLGRVAAHA